MKVNISREGRFIPEWRDNRDAPAGDQVVVHYSNLSHEQRRKFDSSEKPLLKLDDFEAKTDKELDEEITRQHASLELKIDSESNERIAAAMVQKIDGLEGEDGTPIDTWKKLCDCPQSAENQIAFLVDEIRTHMVKEAREKDPKNS